MKNFLENCLAITLILFVAYLAIYGAIMRFWPLHEVGTTLGGSMSKHGANGYIVFRPEPLYQYYKTRDWDNTHWGDIFIPVSITEEK